MATQDNWINKYLQELQQESIESKISRLEFLELLEVLCSKNGKKSLNLKGVVPYDNDKRASVAACRGLSGKTPIPKEQQQHDDNNNNNKKNSFREIEKQRQKK